MSSQPSKKLVGINVWFIIEILSFYGYILSAILFIYIKSIESSLGLYDKTHMPDRHKFDFLAYHEQDVNWIAFVFILLFVNVGLIVIDEFFVFTEEKMDSGGGDQ